MTGEKKIQILGNLKNETFMQRWTAIKAKEIRYKLKTGNRNFSPCDVCDVKGTCNWKRSFRGLE